MSIITLSTSVNVAVNNVSVVIPSVLEVFPSTEPRFRVDINSASAFSASGIVYTVTADASGVITGLQGQSSNSTSLAAIQTRMQYGTWVLPSGTTTLVNVNFRRSGETVERTMKVYPSTIASLTSSSLASASIGHYILGVVAFIINRGGSGIASLTNIFPDIQTKITAINNAVATAIKSAMDTATVQDKLIEALARYDNLPISQAGTFSYVPGQSIKKFRFETRLLLDVDIAYTIAGRQFGLGLPALPLIFNCDPFLPTSANYYVNTDGLTVWVDPNNASSYPGSGSVVTDLVSGASHSMVGSYTYSASGMRLNNTNLTVGASNVSNLRLASTSNIKTVSLWFYNHGTTSTNRFLLDGRTGSSEAYLSGAIGTDWSTGTLYTNGGTSQSITFSNFGLDAIPSGKWVNKTLIANKSFTDDLTLFGRYTNVEGANVTIGVVLVYNRVLTEAENRANYDSLRIRYGL